MLRCTLNGDSLISSRARRAAVVLILGVVRQALAQTPCIDKLRQMKIEKSSELVSFGLATGKELPKDAGKYSLCHDLDNARYFLAAMDVKEEKVAGSYVIPVEFGICLPNLCNNLDVTVLLEGGLSRLFPEFPDLDISNVTSTSPSLDVQSWSVGGFVALAFVGAVICMVFASTAVVYFRQRRSLGAPCPLDSATSHLQLTANGDGGQPVELGREVRYPMLVEAFSLIGRNGTLVKLFEPQAYRSTDCLNGMRVLSMFWIILGHTFLMPTGISGYINYEDIIKSPLRHHSAEESPSLMLILSAENGVDTFFYLSGFLLSHLTMKELVSRGGKISALNALALRYLRLTPSLAMAMLIYYKIVAFLGSGPFAARLQDSINGRCDGSWWSELLYTMNFFPFDSDKVCMGWTWYLGDDMIFFLVGIVLLPIYYRRPWLGWAVTGIVFAMSMGVTSWLIVSHHLGVYVFDYHYTEYSYYAYSKPYTRIGAYLVGITSAWILDSMEQAGWSRETLKVSRKAKLIARASAIAAAVFLLFLILIPSTDFGKYINSWGDGSNVLYLFFGRIAWACCLAVITTACYFNLLPLADRFLSHRGWLPLMRLTYGAYLCHPIVIKLLAGREMQYYNFTLQDVGGRFVSNVLVSYVAAGALWCLIERPIMTITSKFLRKSGRDKPARQPDRSP